MSNENIIFNINFNQFIEFCLPCSKQELHPCDDITGMFIDHGVQYLLFRDMAEHNISMLNCRLKQAMNNNLELHSSLNQNLGYLWGEYIQKKPGHNFVCYKEENLLRWIGINYLLWSPADSCDYWLYNQRNKIIFEVTPAYKWHFDKPKEGEEFIAYDEFIKDYKSCVIVEIPKKVALQWIAMTDELLNIMEVNAKNHGI